MSVLLFHYCSKPAQTHKQEIAHKISWLWGFVLFLVIVRWIFFSVCAPLRAISGRSLWLQSYISFTWSYVRKRESLASVRLNRTVLGCAEKISPPGYSGYESTSVSAGLNGGQAVCPPSQFGGEGCAARKSHHNNLGIRKYLPVVFRGLLTIDRANAVQWQHKHSAAAGWLLQYIGSRCATERLFPWASLRRFIFVSYWVLLLQSFLSCIH